MFGRITIGWRIGASFAALLGFLIAVAAVGYRGLGNISATTFTAVEGPASQAEDGARALAHTLGLRRFEKDWFFAIEVGGAPKLAEYEGKWLAERRELDERLAAIERRGDAA